MLHSKHRSCINDATTIPLLGPKIHNDTALSLLRSPHQNSDPLPKTHAHGHLLESLMEHLTYDPSHLFGVLEVVYYQQAHPAGYLYFGHCLAFEATNHSRTSCSAFVWL